MSAPDESTEEEGGVVLEMTCDICGVEFWWNVGVDPDDSSCPECQKAAPQTD